MLADLNQRVISEKLSGADARWADVTVLRRCGSTNAELLQDARPWRVMVADEQVSGRGRLERVWETPPGVAVAVSVSLPLPADMTRLAWFSPITAMAMAQAVTEVTGVRTVWKWPNDVLAARADGQPAAADGSRWGKLCGILGQVSPVSTLVMGVGVNVAQSWADLPVPLATSVAACSGDVGPATRDEIVAAFALRLGALHDAVVAGGDALERVQADYRAGCLTIGHAVRVSLPDGTDLCGTAIGVDDGAQLVVSHDGVDRPLGAGDVVHVRAERGYTGDVGPGDRIFPPANAT